MKNLDRDFEKALKKIIQEEGLSEQDLDNPLVFGMGATLDHLFEEQSELIKKHKEQSNVIAMPHNNGLRGLDYVDEFIQQSVNAFLHTAEMDKLPAREKDKWGNALGEVVEYLWLEMDELPGMWTSESLKEIFTEFVPLLNSDKPDVLQGIASHLMNYLQFLQISGVITNGEDLIKTVKENQKAW